MIDADRLRRTVWRRPWSRLRQPIEATASARDDEVWLVGGFLRDLLLERVPRDFDLVVSGDGVGFGRALAAALGAEAVVSERFLTVHIRLADDGHLDVATARRESYPAPGALPEVEVAGLDEDLERRDFTINTVALALAGLDRHRDVPTMRADARAEADLAERVVRVLHAGSFEDDPTRLLRAVRLEVDIGGRMDAQTERQARAAIAGGALGTVSGPRLWREIEASLVDPATAVPILERWADLGLWEELLPGARSWAESRQATGALLAITNEIADGLGADRRTTLVGGTLLALLGPAASSWAEHYRPPRAYTKLFDGAPAVEAAASELAVGVERPSELHRLLAPLLAVQLALLAGQGYAEPVRRSIALRDFALEIGPRDLMANGAVSGPELGRALDRTLVARLDGEIDQAAELNYALRELRALRGAATESESPPGS